MQNCEIQGLGHADLIQAPDGSWWMICLGYRTSGYLQHVMGRETFLAPVRWDEGAWPVIDEISNPTFIGCRQTQKTFEAIAKLDVSEIKPNTQAGITAYISHLNHYDMIVDCDDQGEKTLQSVIRIGQSKNVMNINRLNGDTVYLRISSDGQFYYLSYSTDNKEFTPMCKMEYRYLSTETIGGFTGVHLGVYVQSQNPNGYVDLDLFEYVTD